jgi:hypothetical protein
MPNDPMVIEVEAAPRVLLPTTATPIAHPSPATVTSTASHKSSSGTPTNLAVDTPSPIVGSG